jgi:hypothetical protein
MFCSPLIAYILICLAIFVQYPRYSLTSLNMISNLFQCILLYYLCSIGWKRTAWAIVIIPILFVIFFYRKFFHDYASSFEVNNKKSKK